MEYLFLLISLAGIVLGADFLVSGSVSIARKFKVSDFVIGAAIIGVGTSAPELTVSFIGALNGNADVALGNVVGSNIFNVLGILGITAMFFPVTFGRQNLKFEIRYIDLVIADAVFVQFLQWNRTVSRQIGRRPAALRLCLLYVALFPPGQQIQSPGRTGGRGRSSGSDVACHSKSRRRSRSAYYQL